MIRQFGFVP
jgi:solute carrier family 25 phosphate transporter 3